MKFTASVAALILLQGFAIALPREPGVQAVGENRLPLTHPKPSPSSDGGGRDPGAEVDDYPDKDKCDQSDRNQLTACQCTAFVGWRVTERLGVKNFTDYGPWGNAKEWADVARKGGLTVNDKPAPGAIAQTTKGVYGHVAWVHAVNGDELEIEDYNGLGGSKKYGKGKQSASEFPAYIHF